MVEDVERGTMSDALLREVLEFTRNGWKDKETKRDDQLRPYFSRDELSIEGNCLMWAGDQGFNTSPNERIYPAAAQSYFHQYFMWLFYCREG